MRVNRDKYADIIAWIIAIIMIGLAVFVGSINHYKVYYKNEKPLSYQEACDKAGTAAGYPPGADIPVAKSIEDIMENEYCTIEVSKENISSTRTFLIKDASEAGDFYSHVGRKHVGRHVDESYGMRFNFLSDILYYTRQSGWNLDETSYGEWCVVTLDSGEKVYVLVDLMLLDIPSEKNIKLPIGQITRNGSRVEADGQSASFGVLEENRGWYVDMVGNWEDTEVGDIDPIMRGVAFFALEIVICIGLSLIVKLKRKKKE